MKAMRAFRVVSAALLKRFLSTGLKTFEQIEQIEQIGCLHPTGRHWVNNFLLLFMKKEKNPKIMALPPTSANPLQHVLRVHLQVMLWKAADECYDITNFGWVIQDTIPIPAVAQGAPVPRELIKCQCKAPRHAGATLSNTLHVHHTV